MSYDMCSISLKVILFEHSLLTKEFDENDGNFMYCRS